LCFDAFGGQSVPSAAFAAAASTTDGFLLKEAQHP
jgi:hypothetical protein